ncbi:hypothetical protein TNCV_2929321 [Trichonephila clavipes]|nr:hypothetical protein TNCV_2929321 [Trichonephila clavipes]
MLAETRVSPSLYSRYASNFSLRKSNEAQKPDSIDHPIAAMPPSRMQNSTLVMPLIEDLSRYWIEDSSYSPEAQKSTPIQ